MVKDKLYEAIQRARRKSTVQRFVESPMRTMQERRYILYVISASIAASGAAVALRLGADLAQVGIIAFVLAIIPPGFYHLQETTRIRRMEAEFPALVRDLSLSMKSGMNPRGAIRIAAQGHYCALTPAI